MLPLFIYAPLRFSTNRGVAKTANISETSTVMTTNKKKRKNFRNQEKYLLNQPQRYWICPKINLATLIFFEIGVVFYPLRTMTLWKHDCLASIHQYTLTATATMTAKKCLSATVRPCGRAVECGHAVLLILAVMITQWKHLSLTCACTKSPYQQGWSRSFILKWHWQPELN